MMGLKQQQNQVKEAIEKVKLDRLKVKLKTEQEGLKADNFTLQKAQVTTQISQEGVTQERIKLETTKIGTQSLMVGKQKAQIQLSYEKADLVLDGQMYASKLQLKSLDVSALREDIRTKQVMIGTSGNGAKVPQIKG